MNTKNPNLQSIPLVVRLRPAHVNAFQQMQRDCGQLSQNDLATELLESSIAEYIRVRLPDAPLLVGPLIPDLKKTAQETFRG